MNIHITIVVITLMFTGTTIGMAQEELKNESNSTNSNRRDQSESQLNTNNSPVISISNDDFWKLFGPLIEQKSNTSIVSSGK